MYYSIDDQHGTFLCGGIETYHKALARAQELANATGAAVLLYGSEPLHEGDEGEIIHPEAR